jgi:ribosomal protein S18 acetylase RimI-like enzyme
VEGIDATSSVSPDDGAELWLVYREVFDDHDDVDTWREQVWDRHRTRSGFRLVRSRAAGALTGFAYGYTGEHGQWWTDHVREVMEPLIADEWLGGHFEVVSLGVVTAARGSGTGRRLMQELLRDLPHERRLLMATADADDPARRLYDSTGWQVVSRGIGSNTVVLGARR